MHIVNVSVLEIIHYLYYLEIINAISPFFFVLNNDIMKTEARYELPAAESEMIL